MLIPPWYVRTMHHKDKHKHRASLATTTELMQAGLPTLKTTMPLLFFNFNAGYVYTYNIGLIWICLLILLCLSGTNVMPRQTGRVYFYLSSPDSIIQQQSAGYVIFVCLLHWGSCIISANINNMYEWDKRKLNLIISNARYIPTCVCIC